MREQLPIKRLTAVVVRLVNLVLVPGVLLKVLSESALVSKSSAEYKGVGNLATERIGAEDYFRLADYPSTVATATELCAIYLGDLS
jgi:hypothetical protein